MSHCTSCGNQLADDDKFCPNCGRIVEKQPPALARVETRKKRMPRRAYIVGSVAIVVIIALVVGLLLGDSNADRIIRLEEGASISIPRGAVSSDAVVTASTLDPESAPAAPEGLMIETLYEFGIDEPLAKPVTLRLPLPSVTEESVLWLARYDEVAGGWHGVGFTVEDGYAVVETDTLSIWGTIRGTWDDFTDWAAKTGGSFQSWYREEVFPWLTTDHYISWFEEVSGLDKMIYEPLFATSPELICDHSQSRGLISASARLMSEDRIEIRIRNDTKMYVHLYFDGPSVEPIQGGYISLADIRRFVETTPEMKSVVESSFLEHGVILLPECTADFRTYMSSGEVLSIRTELSDAAALINALEPAFALVTIADLEAATAVRDLKGAQSEFSLALEVYQDEWLWKTIVGLDLVAETMRTGWLLGTKGLQTLANIALAGVPAVTGLADRAVGIAEEILDKGQDAILGGRIVVSHREGEEEPMQYRVSISSTAGGSVTTPGERTFSYDAGTVVELVAEAEEGYHFVTWTGDVDPIADPDSPISTIRMEGNYLITATFAGEDDGLADSPWPKFRQNLQNAGRSPYTGPETPQLKWSFTTGGAVFSSPAIGADGTIYIGSLDSKVYAISLDSSLKWSFTTGGVVRSSPAIGADGTIYVGSRDHKLYAISREGSLKWSFTTGGAVTSSPAIGADGTVYVGSWDNKLYAISPDSSLKWSYTTGGYVYSSPAIGADGTIYVGSIGSHDRQKLYAITPDGTEKWSFTTGKYVYSSPAIGPDGTIYIGSDDSELYAIKPDGSLKWSFTTGLSVYSSPAIGADGTIYVGSWDSKLYAISREGSLKWSFTTADAVLSSPAIGADGTIYVGSYDRKVRAIKPDGSLKWSFTTGGAVTSSPAIGADGTIYVGSHDRKLYAIGEGA